MTDITELAQLRGRTVDYPYYLVECDCGKIYPSSELSGGEPMGDSGDYSDCYCPHCGEGEEHFAECADPETAWKAQQDKIDALVEALEKAQQQMTESENRVRKQNRHICELFDDNTALRQRIAELESRLNSADKLQDSAFRSGLQHGFSLGQTDDQKGYEQSMAAYSPDAGNKVEAE